MISDEFRLSYRECRDLLVKRLTESPPPLIQLLAGPRQVGKTTLLLELADRFERTAIYAAADGPEATLSGFWERLWVRAEKLAEREQQAVVLLDEAHLFLDWAARLKGEWDRFRRLKLPVQIVATGSSALHLGAGSRESLAGRFERITLTHWSASSLAEVFNLPPFDAVQTLVRTGTYPGAFVYRKDATRWSAYVRDAILEPAIGRDLLALGAVRKPALLRQVFAVCASSPAQIISLQKIQGQLQDAGALETIAYYLRLLEEAFLIAPISNHSLRRAGLRPAPPKLITLSNAFLAAVHPRGAPDQQEEPARFGAWVENACLAHAWNAGQRVSYWREEPMEVDGVLEGSWGRWVIEVKTGAISSTDLRGLTEFVRRHPSYRPLVLCDPTESTAVARLGIEAMSWPDYLLARPNPGNNLTQRR